MGFLHTSAPMMRPISVAFFHRFWGYAMVCLLTAGWHAPYVHGKNVGNKECREDEMFLTT